MNRSLKALWILALISGFITACQTSPRTGKLSHENGPSAEPHRPGFHFSPDSMWMNDPNGMVYFDGEYHLFYQHNPYDNVWGPMHWGHAVSTDLVQWEHLPIALYPDNLGTIFSGSAVMDRRNSSGLGSSETPPMVAIFTQHNPVLETSGSNQFQCQSMAYSLDKGRSWTMYEGNPVLENPGIRDFRDPKVTWYEEKEQWIMVLAAHDRIIFYSSPNLIEWTKEDEFSAIREPGEGVWECPDLFPLAAGGDQKWILLVSVGAGGPNQGSGTRYFVGTFDGHRFTSEHAGESPRWIDHGKDNYAGVTWSDIPADDGRRIFLGWMSNWQYANRVPTERWRGAMTFPRELILEQRQDQFLVISRPVTELMALRKGKALLETGTLEGTRDAEGIGDFPASQYEIEVEFEIVANQAGDGNFEFGLILSNKRQQRIIAGFNPGRQVLFIDRNRSGNTGFSENFPGLHTAPFQMNAEGTLTLHALVDRSSIELFADHGRVVLTEIFFPDEDFNEAALFAKGGSVRVKNGTIYSLKRAVKGSH